MINTAEYNLARYLDSYIKPNIPDEYMLTSSQEFLNTLSSNKSSVSSNHHMVSFDVTSLFTNVPLNESIQLAADYVYSPHSKKRPDFSKDVFVKLMEFATSGIIFYTGSVSC